MRRRDGSREGSALRGGFILLDPSEVNKAMARGTVRRKSKGIGIVRNVLRTLTAACAVWIVFTAGIVLTLRYVDPPLTAMMLQQPVPLADVDFRWVPRAHIAAAAAHAVMASEDQRFLDHNLAPPPLILLRHPIS
jgi:membrane peptidoglycan carboxypeptidase